MSIFEPSVNTSSALGRVVVPTDGGTSGWMVTPSGAQGCCHIRGNLKVPELNSISIPNEPGPFGLHSARKSSGIAPAITDNAALLVVR